MNSIPRLRFFVIFVLSPVLIYSLCSKTTTSETEPNESIASANPLVAGNQMEGYLGTNTDVDYYKIFIASPSIINISLTEVRGINHSFTCWDHTGKTKILHVDDARKSSPERMCNLHWHGGYLYISIQHGDRDSPAANLENPYYLKVETRAIKTNEELEPNNSSESATRISLNEEIFGYFSPAFSRSSTGTILPEVDWFVFETEIANNQPQLLDIKLSPVEEIDSEITLISSTTKVITTINAHGIGKGEAAEGIGLFESGSYFVVISSANGAYNCTASYQLYLKTRPFDFRTEIEPNDSREFAQIIQEEVTGGFTSRDDRDWFAIKKGDGISIAHIEAVPLQHMQLALTIYDSRMNRLFEAKSMAIGQKIVLPNVAYQNDAYIELFPHGAIPDSTPHYILRINSRAHTEGFELEPNDSFSSATLIHGNTLIGFTSKKRDVDYYRVEYTEPTRKKIVINTPSGAKITFSIANLKKQIFRNIIVHGGTQKVLYETFDAQCYVIVKALSENYREPYVIHCEDN
ncbi:MAG: hypothetical protein N2316_12160 [Spirochaetes bacterium]|nr:hypothetical protein [Spirochaetota bacterium]